MGTSPSREKSDDFTDGKADEYQEAARAGAVKRKWSFRTDCIQATVTANGGRTGDGSIPDAFGMAVDQQDQPLPIQGVLRRERSH
jgi:hypothetical protein